MDIQIDTEKVIQNYKTPQRSHKRKEKTKMKKRICLALLIVTVFGIVKICAVEKSPKYDRQR